MECAWCSSRDGAHALCFTKSKDGSAGLDKTKWTCAGDDERARVHLGGEVAVEARHAAALHHRERLLAHAHPHPRARSRSTGTGAWGRARGEGSGAAGCGGALRRLWGEVELRRAALLGIAMMAMNQFSGINTVMYYSATVLVGVGFSATDAVWMSAACCLAQVCGVIVSVLSMDRLGRRPTALRSVVGVAITLTADDGQGGRVTEAFDLQIQAFNSAPVVASPVADQTGTEDVAFTADAFGFMVVSEQRRSMRASAGRCAA